MIRDIRTRRGSHFADKTASISRYKGICSGTCGEEFEGGMFAIVSLDCACGAVVGCVSLVLSGLERNREEREQYIPTVAPSVRVSDDV